MKEFVNYRITTNLILLNIESEVLQTYDEHLQALQLCELLQRC